VGVEEHDETIYETVKPRLSMRGHTKQHKGEHEHYRVYDVDPAVSSRHYQQA